MSPGALPRLVVRTPAGKSELMLPEEGY
jgi:hypothetical protein